MALNGWPVMTMSKSQGAFSCFFTPNCIVLCVTPDDFFVSARVCKIILICSYAKLLFWLYVTEHAEYTIIIQSCENSESRAYIVGTFNHGLTLASI